MLTVLKKCFRIAIFTIIFSIPLSASAQNIAVFGVGRLGICVALCLEKAGYNVLGVDLAQEYIDKLNSKTFISSEPSVTELLKASQNFRATTSLKEAIDFADVYFITVSTTIGTYGYDYTMLTDLLTQLNSHSLAGKHIVINSTVFPGYIKDTALPLLKNCKNVTLSYNPPFIAQGAIVQGFQTPDMVLIGEGSPEVGEILEAVYQKVCINSPHIARMSVPSAEIAKLALNCYVTAKIAFANLVGDIADETEGADKFVILNALGKDKRIGEKCLMPGYGFGGPCFPRDNRALGAYALTKGIEPSLFTATDHVNHLHAEYMAKKCLLENLDEYVFEDVSYKPNSPVAIIEASQKLLVAKIVAEHGKKVTLVDKKSVISLVQEKYGDLFTYVVK